MSPSADYIDNKNQRCSNSHFSRGSGFANWLCFYTHWKQFNVVNHNKNYISIQIYNVKNASF